MKCFPKASGLIGLKLQVRQGQSLRTGSRWLSMADSSHEHRSGGLIACQAIQHGGQLTGSLFGGCHLRQGNFLIRVARKNQRRHLRLQLQAKFSGCKPEALHGTSRIHINVNSIWPFIA
jgi:hypothetical protein